MAFDFKEKKLQAQATEHLLDEFFTEQGYKVSKSPEVLDRYGIDRLLVRPGDHVLFGAEYKSDFIAHKTGLMFIETTIILQSSERKKGWAKLLLADWLCYFIVGTRQIYLLSCLEFKLSLARWLSPEAKYRKIQDVKNIDWRTGQEYYGQGILVPLDHIFNECGLEVYTANEGDTYQ